MGRVQSENLGMDGRIILEWILGKYDGEVWTDLTQDRDLWQVLVNMEMDLQVP